jgi:hypothetical protein
MLVSDLGPTVPTRCLKSFMSNMRITTSKKITIGHWHSAKGKDDLRHLSSSDNAQRRSTACKCVRRRARIEKQKGKGKGKEL